MNEKDIRERITNLEREICFCTVQIQLRKSTGNIRDWVDRRNQAIREIETLTHTLVKGERDQ